MTAKGSVRPTSGSWAERSPGAHGASFTQSPGSPRNRTRDIPAHPRTSRSLVGLISKVSGKTESDEDWRGADCCGNRLGLEETGQVCEVSFKKERKEAEPRVWAARGGRGWPGV